MGENPYEAIRIGENSWRIEENGVRAFLFVGEERALLVDSGYGTGNIRTVVERLTALPVLLVNTHADGDHVNGNVYFEKAYMHPAEFDYYHRADGRSCPAEPLWENDRIDLGNRRFEVVLIPGHTPGSIALLDAENKILIAGDSVQLGMTYMFGPGRNLYAFIFSMEKLRMLRGQFDTVYPSHGPFPADAAVLDAIIEGAKQVRDGKIAGGKAPFETEARLYIAGDIKFLYKA